MATSEPRSSSGPQGRRGPRLAILAASLVALALPATVAATSVPPDTGWNQPDHVVQASAEGLDTDRLSAATVLISGDRYDPTNTGWGSGSIISKDGLILTNAHVAANRAPGVSVQYPDIRYEPPSPLTLYVYTVDSATDRAEPSYQAEVVAVDGYLDLAVLRIVAYADGVPIDPADLDLTPVEIGSAADLRPLDELIVAGYPGISETFAVRFTRGELNNFSDDERVGRDAWLHTDAKIASGNSGGLAVDAAGRLVAVPTQTTSDGPDGAVDYNMRPIDLALPLIEAAKSGVPYDTYKHVVRPSGTESATVIGWSDERTDTCSSGRDTVPLGTEWVYPQIQFDGMNGGDHVVVELVDRSEDTPGGAVVDYTAFDWPDEYGASACLPVTLGLDRAFPQGEYGPFFEGAYGVDVRVGPIDEVDATAAGASGVVRVVDGSGSGPDPVFAMNTPRPVKPDQTSRRAVEDALLQLAASAGFECRPWRQEGRYDPFSFGATGAIICEEGLTRQDVAQLALFAFPDLSSMDKYWQYRIGEIPGRMPRDPSACREGSRGITTWQHGDVACYVSTSEAGTRAARIRWTDERMNTYGVVYGIVDATDLDLPGLVGWWQSSSP